MRVSLNLQQRTMMAVLAMHVALLLVAAWIQFLWHPAQAEPLTVRVNLVGLAGGDGLDGAPADETEPDPAAETEAAMPPAPEPPESPPQDVPAPTPAPEPPEPPEPPPPVPTPAPPPVRPEPAVSSIKEVPSPPRESAPAEKPAVKPTPAPPTPKPPPKPPPRKPVAPKPPPSKIVPVGPTSKIRQQPAKEPAKEPAASSKWRSPEEIRRSFAAAGPASASPARSGSGAPSSKLTSDQVAQRLRSGYSRLRVGSASRSPGAPGTGSGTAGDSGSAAMGQYYDAVGAMLYRIWRQPSRSEVGRGRPTVQVALTILADGQVAASRVIGPSGVAAMDESVMRVLKLLRRLPLPSEYGIDARSIEIQVTFELD